MLMDRAVETLDHFPSIVQCEEIAKDLGFKHASGWKYFEVDDCLVCGGAGWHWVKRPDDGEGVVACDDCRAGKNMQQAPKGTISWTMKQSPGAIYTKPGR